MRKTAILIVAGLAVMALAVVVVRQQGELREAREVAAQAKQQAQTAAAEATAAKAVTKSAKKEEEQVLQHLRTAEAEVKAASAPAATGAVSVRAASLSRHVSTNDVTPFAGIAKMMRDPGMKSMIRAQQQGQMDMTYGPLFKGLSLSAEDQEAFKKLLLDKQMALVDLSMGVMDGSATPEQRKDLASKIADSTKTYDAQIKALLGDENYPVYQEYEATQPERMQVNLFKQSLSGEDALSEQQEHDLIRTLYTERKDFPEIAKQYDHSNPPDPSTFTQAMITNQLAVLAQLQEKSTERAATVLTASQLAQFKKSQDQMRTMQEMGLKMAAQMFGGNKGGSGQ